MTREITDMPRDQYVERCKQQALYQRRNFRYTAIEVTKLVFGLSIPLLERDEFTFGHILRLRSSLRTRRM